MEFILHEKGTTKIAELKDSSVLNELSDFMDVLGNASWQDAAGVIIKKEHLTDQFFDLKSRFAGEVLQKFSNYRIKLAIVGDFSTITSKSLNDFIGESNRMGHILFVESKEKALELL